jgi:hypothetical protein
MPDITTIFSVADARGFDKAQLTSAVTYPDAAITAAEVAIRAEFERIIGVALIPTSTAEVLDGNDTDTLFLAHHNPYSEFTPRPVSVTACVITDRDGVTYETFDADDLSDLACYPSGEVIRLTNGRFLRGRRNVTLTYSHGFTAVQPDIQRAALIECVRRLAPTSVPFSGTGGTEDGITWARLRDPSRGRWYGMEEIDGVLNQYRARETAPGIA